MGEASKIIEDHLKKPRVFNGREEFPSSNILHAIVALGIWLGAIHFIAILVLFSPLPPSLQSPSVNDVHGKFVEALRDLFERHKARVGHADLELKVL